LFSCAFEKGTGAVEIWLRLELFSSPQHHCDEIARS
jgi:hypothetical protein